MFCVWILFGIAHKILRKRLLKKAKTKKQIATIKIFSRIIYIVFVIVLIVSTFLAYVGSWTGLGMFAGLFTAGMGFALQKPITGLAAWIMVITKNHLP